MVGCNQEGRVDAFPVASGVRAGCCEVRCDLYASVSMVALLCIRSAVQYRAPPSNTAGDLCALSPVTSSAAELLNELMGLLRKHVRASPTLRKKLFQANFHTTLSGQSMVSDARVVEGGRTVQPFELVAVMGFTAHSCIIKAPCTR